MTTHRPDTSHPDGENGNEKVLFERSGIGGWSGASILIFSEPFLVKILRALVCALLAVVALVAAAPRAHADPVPAPYAGQAGGDVAAVNLAVGALTLADVRLANSDSTVDSTGTPESSSISRNLAAVVAGLGIAVEENSQTAPPDNAGPVTDSIASLSALGISTGLLTTSNEAHYTGDASCVTGDALADTSTSTAGLSVVPVGLLDVLTTGVSSTTGTVGLVSTGGAGFNRAVESTATGELAGVSLLGGGVTIEIADAQLTATAPGTPGDAEVTYNEPLVTVNGTPIGASGTVTVDLGVIGAVTVDVNDVVDTVAPDGTSASASVSVVTLTVRVGPDIPLPAATATVDLLPLTVSADAPVGGIDCPPPAPVVTEPDDEEVVDDTTPTYTGTGEPGAVIDLVVDGTTLEDVATVDGDGDWEFTQPTALAQGPHTVSAIQTLNGAPSVASAVNDFFVDTEAPDAPEITDPDEGTSIGDNTPTVTGTGEPGATVVVEVDGDVVGDAEVDGDGNWELPLTDPLDDGEHTITATQTDEAGNESDADEVTFVVDTEALPPVITAPEDGSSTDDTTPTIEGTAEPGATVEVSIDGTPVGSVVADEDGDWSLELTDPLDEGDHTVSAVQTDEAGNVSDPAENDFTVDTTAPAAPVITSPDDGDTVTDPSPTIEGTGEPGTTIVIVVDGEPVGSVVVDEDGDWSFTLPELSDGDHTIVAIAVDDAGNESGADQITITVDSSGPELADTGGPSLAYAIAGGVLLVAGGTVLSLTRRRA